MKREEMVRMEEFDSVEDMGCFKYIRSSACRDDMITTTPVYVAEISKWMEVFEGWFTCEEDEKAMTEDYDAVMERFWHENPYADVKESFFEIVYGQNDDEIEYMLGILMRRGAGENPHMVISEQNISRIEAEKTERMISEWHKAFN